MKKISDYKNEDALDLLADLIEPVAMIFADKELVAIMKDKNGKKIDAIRVAIKNHKAEVIQILARLDGIDPNEADYSVVAITMKLLEVLNDKELMDFFILQQPKEEKKSSGAVTEITKAKGK